MFKKVAAQHGGKRIAGEFVVVHLHEDVGEFGRAHADQITDPLPVRAQAHGEVSRLGAQKAVHFAPLGKRGWKRLERALAELLQGVVALVDGKFRVERRAKFPLCTPAIVTKVSPGVLAKAAQGGGEGVAELEAMLAANTAGFDAQLTLLVEAVCGGFGCALGDGGPSDPRVGLKEELMNRKL